MHASRQYLWPQTGSVGLVFSHQQLSSHNGLCGFQVQHVYLPSTGRNKSSSGSYLCGRHHHHRQLLTGCHSSYSWTRPGVFIKRPYCTIFWAWSVTVHPQVSFSQHKYIHDLLLWLKIDGVKPVSSPMATSCKLSNLSLIPLSIEVRLGLYNT